VAGHHHGVLFVHSLDAIAHRIENARARELAAAVVFEKKDVGGLLEDRAAAAAHRTGGHFHSDVRASRGLLFLRGEENAIAIRTGSSWTEQM
jgi:hypothetical protein